MSQTIASLLGDLYGCLLREKPEVHALDVLCSAIGARHAFIMRAGPTSGRSMATSHHLTSIDLAGLDRLSASPEYVQVLASMPPGSFTRMTDLVSRKELLGSDAYQVALRPLDGGLAACGMQLDGNDVVIGAICRSLSTDPDFDDDAISTLQICMPHLVTVMTLAERMERERCRASPHSTRWMSCRTA